MFLILNLTKKKLAAPNTSQIDMISPGIIFIVEDKKSRLNYCLDYGIHACIT